MINKHYSVILGVNVSRSARSPKVWNEWYEKSKSSVRMKPIDVNSDYEFEQIINKLKNDKYCLGGAVAVPFKGLMAEILKSPDGAINCFYRDKNEVFIGTNTDALAGEKLILDNINEKDHILFIGNGHTGSAILKRSSIEQHKSIVVYARTLKTDLKIKQKKIYEINDLVKVYERMVLFNATSVGGPMAINKELISENSFKRLISYGLYKVIDINNAQAEKSHLEKLCSNYDICFINGNQMNEHQARLAFDLVNKYI